MTKWRLPRTVVALREAQRAVSTLLATMAQSPNRAQLENGAKGIAYRAWQLAGVASLLRRAPTFQRADPRDVTTISTALVESALVR